MNQKIKIALYAALIIGAIVFGSLFYSSYKKADKSSAEPVEYPPTNVAAVPTNSASASTNLSTTNTVVAETNQATQTNVTNQVAESNEAPPALEPHSPVATAKAPAQGRSTMVGYLFAFVVIAIFLGLLIARDISEYFGSRSVEFMFNDEGTGIKDPEYEEAEQEWANGHHLEAIRMMRDYLIKNPREQYVSLRIAEIYEKDLKNPLAAALEYEEVLKYKLPPERWGWAAIHLCNLYSKMDKTDQAVALLHRIIDEYGETAAAKKARERLGILETTGEEVPNTNSPDPVQTESPSDKSEEKPSNLPPGFRPKK